MFVTFEGPEGAGKSTVLRQVAAGLRAQGLSVTETREPGAGAVGAAIRDILLHGGDLPAETELFLFLADRSHHVATVVRPALEQGHIVLCDRFGDSTIVYQGYARGFDIETLRQLNALATRGLAPDLTLLFDLEPSAGLARLAQPDRLDREPLEFHESVRRGFLIEAERAPERWRIVDAGAPLDSVVQDALSHVLAHLRESSRSS